MNTPFQNLYLYGTVGERISKEISCQNDFLRSWYAWGEEAEIFHLCDLQDAEYINLLGFV